MQANFEVKYLDVAWYDQDTVLSIQESFIPVKVEFDDERQHFVCHTVIYPKAYGVKHGQLAFRYLKKNSSVPYLEAVDNAAIKLKKVVDKESGKEWWIEANSWLPKQKCWESKTRRTASKLVVGLQDQLCQVNISSSEFTAEELDRYLSDFKSDLWELILDESSYVTGAVKKTQNGGVTEESIHIISNVLSHAQKILNNPKSELREIQTLKPKKMVRPVTRTFMELATKSDNRFLTSRATKPSYNVPENRYLLFALERICKILKQLVRIAESKEKRFDATVKKLNERCSSFKNEKLINKNLVRKDLEKIKESYDLNKLNRSLEWQLKSLGACESLNENLEKWYVKVGSKTRDGSGYFCGVKKQENDDWFEGERNVHNVFLNFSDNRYQELLEKDFEYELQAEISLADGVSSSGIPKYTYNIIKIASIKMIDGAGLERRREKFQAERKKAMALNSKEWIKKLSPDELREQEREKISIQNQLKLYEEHLKKSKKAHELLEPKLAKFYAILKNLKRLEVKPLSTFPNSMTFVQNPDYQAVHFGYKSLLNLTNLTDEDLLLSLEEIDEIGLINMPILYERWCLLQIVKVLIQKYRYIPEDNWKRKLVKIVSMGRRGQKESLNFKNSNIKRNIHLMYEPTLGNGRIPDFVMDISFEKKNNIKDVKRFVMDAKFYSYDWLKGLGGISSVINTLYHEKNYSEDGKNAVFMLHPVKNAIPEEVSPQSWGANSFLGELEMFTWDKPLREKHYHKYGAIYASPVAGYLDEFQRLIGMFLQFGIEDNYRERNSDDVESINFCMVCGSHELTTPPKSKSVIINKLHF